MDSALRNASSQASAPATQVSSDVTPDHTAEPGAEKFLKREFLAENRGQQPVSAEPSGDRGEQERTAWAAGHIGQDT